MLNYMVSGFIRNNEKGNKRNVVYETDSHNVKLNFTKAEVLACIIENPEYKQIKDLLVHYRHSELPSPTNEVNLVKSDVKSKNLKFD